MKKYYVNDNYITCWIDYNVDFDISHNDRDIAIATTSKYGGPIYGHKYYMSIFPPDDRPIKFRWMNHSKSVIDSMTVKQLVLETGYVGLGLGPDVYRVGEYINETNAYIPTSYVLHIYKDDDNIITIEALKVCNK